MLGHLSTSQRIGIGFMLMLILLCLVVVIASIGIDRIVDSAKYLLEGNKLRTELMAHEIEHLEWEEDLYTFLTDARMDKLTIPLDERQCKFGKWLYGKERRQMEVLVPASAPLLKMLEEPHHQLHKSAQKIQTIFHRANHNLPNFLIEQTFLHLQWVMALGNSINNPSSPSFNMLDTDKCSLKQWPLSEHSWQMEMNWHSDFKLLWEQMLLAHAELHASMQQVSDQIALNSNISQVKESELPKQLFFTDILPRLQKLLTYLATLKSKALQDIQTEHKADDILRNESTPNHNLVQQHLHEIRAVMDQAIVTDEKMLLLAQHTRNLIAGISILTLLLAALMAVRTGRDIIIPLNYLTNKLMVMTNDTTNLATKSSCEYIHNPLPSKVSLTMFRHNTLFNLVKLFILWRRSNVNIGTKINKMVRNNVLTRIIERVNILQLFNTTYVPVEIEALIRAIGHYTDCQAEMVAKQQQFIADVAHQLKNPLAGIYIQMDMIVDDATTQSTEQHARLVKLRAAIHRVGRLIHQLLALARCSADAIDHQAMQPVNLNDLIEENASAWFDTALPKQIDLGFEIEPAVVHGVAWLISEMLNNLVDNAIKYSPVNGNVTVRCGYRNHETLGLSVKIPFLEVEDNGPGVAPSEREKVFERFYRAKNTSNTNDYSVGLGLAIVKEVTRYHHATVEISASQKIGTVFIIQFSNPDVTT